MAAVCEGAHSMVVASGDVGPETGTLIDFLAADELPLASLFRPVTEGRTDARVDRGV